MTCFKVLPRQSGAAWMSHGLPQMATDPDRSLCGQGRLHIRWAPIRSGCTRAIRHGDATNHSHAAPSPVGRPDHLRGDSTRVLPIHVEIRVAVGRRTGDQHPAGARRDGSRSPRSTSRVALTATPTTMDWLRPFGATPTPGRSIRPASRPAVAPCHVRLEPRDVSGHPRRGASPPGTKGRRS